MLGDKRTEMIHLHVQVRRSSPRIRAWRVRWSHTVVCTLVSGSMIVLVFVSPSNGSNNDDTVVMYDRLYL